MVFKGFCKKYGSDRKSGFPDDSCQEEHGRRYENWIVASALLLCLLLFVGIRYDYYYDLNDDVVIKDLMAGVYTGQPEGHNIQVLYPLSLAVSLVYRMFPKMPVYGIFLCLCQYGCLWLMVKRSLCFCKGIGQKVFLAGAEGAVICGLFLGHLVFVQYTVTSALLSAAAAFLFVTSKRESTARGFLKENILGIFLAVLSFQLRTEMMELLLPLICVAGVYRWCMEGKIFTKENYKKYFTVFGMILAGMAVSWAVNRAAFGGGDWKAYVDFFNSRTELYDFQGIPPYDGNEGLYEGLGLEKDEQYMLLDQYNFGLDEALDAAALDTVAQYQASAREASGRFVDMLKEKILLYRYRLFHKEKPYSSVPDDYPWNVMVILGYAAVFLAVAGNGVKGDGERDGKRSSKKSGKESGEVIRHIGKGVGCLAFLFTVRTALWMFILMRGRTPERITHSLYLMEFCILMVMLLMECAGREEEGGWIKTAGSKQQGMGLGRIKYSYLFSIVFTLTAILAMPEEIVASDKGMEDREAANAVYDGMKAYGKAHSGNFYFQDVYSAVSYPFEPYAGTPYSEKMFADVDNGLSNCDIMGGWLVKSPSYKEKLEQFGLESMQEGLLYHENVYMMVELEKGTDDFAAYFKAQGMDTRIELVDEICGIIGVYRVEIK